MRGFDRAVAALALRAMPTRPPKHERRLALAVDDATRDHLNRATLSHQRAALIASLWPEPTRQCVAPPVFVQLAAPAMFGSLLRVEVRSNATDVRALQARIGGVFAASKAAPTPETSKAA